MLKQGLIYEIVCNETQERYIGSTFQPTVARRISKHRDKSSRQCSSMQIIERDNYSYGLLETVNVNSRDELRMKEREWFDKLECINKNRPFRSEEEKQKFYKEYNDSHKEEYKIARKIYNDNPLHQEARRLYDIAHAEELRLKRKIYNDGRREEIKKYNDSRKLQKIKDKLNI